MATVSKSQAAKHEIKIRYRNHYLKEIRVWVVWAETNSNIGPNTYYDFAGVGNPQMAGGFIVTDISFNFTINPQEIVTDVNRPDFSGARMNPPPPIGGTHPFFGGSLSGGANRKWDSSRQMRAHVVNPANISSVDQSFPSFFDIPSYPANDVVGNDDQSTGDPECNNPYSQEGTCTNAIGTLSGKDNPKYGIRHRAGNDSDTFEMRLHFREFVRLEINGVWMRISNFYLWKAHIRFIKQNGLWADNGTFIALNNDGF